MGLMQDGGRLTGTHKVIANPDGMITVSCVKAGGGVTGTIFKSICQLIAEPSFLANIMTRRCVQNF